MRGLFGDFSTMPLKDVVVYLGNRKASGLLHLEQGGIRKQVALKDGTALSASSNEPREYLGQFLINMGQITEDQFTKAYQTQKETQILLGKILTMIGLVSEQVVMNALSMKIRETLLGAFQWSDGTFNFDASELPEPPDGLDLRISLLDIHREGEFRDAAWQAIHAAFSSGRVRLELVEKNLPEAPRPGSLDERLIALIGAGHTIDEMVLALHATDFFIYQRLYALYRLEAVRVAETVEVDLDVSAISPDLGEAPTAEAMLETAELMLSQSNFSAAEPLARRAHELSANVRSTDVLRLAETGLIAELRQALMGGRLVPSLQVTQGRVREMQLTAPERYLLSRVDGRREVSAIVNVSPLRELEALKYFKRFVETGLVRLAAPR